MAWPINLLQMLKTNLIVEHDEDDGLLTSLLDAATSYAIGYQHLPEDFYVSHNPSKATIQAVLMLASHWYESRDGSTGGFYQDSTSAPNAVWVAVNRLLILDRDWKT